MTAALEKNGIGEIVKSFHETKFGEASEYRTKAIANFEQLGLPTNKSEEYRFTPITKAIAKNFEWKNKLSPSSISSIDQFLIDGIEATILVFVNGSYSQSHSKIDHSSKEIKITSLSEAFRADKEVISKYFDKVSQSEADPFAAMNTAFWQEGIFIHVSENTKVERPILFLHISDANQEQVITHSRLLLVVEKGSSLSVIEKFDSVGSNPIFQTLTEEIIVKENAQLEYYKIQNDSGNSHQVTNTVIQQSNSSKVDTCTITLNGQLVRNNFSIVIDGEHCESHFHGLYLLNGNTIADNHTVVDHKKPNSFSNELYKGIMDGNSKGIFNGKIFVRPQAQKTNAFQSNRNILMSEDATVNTKPQLEIWADDVKCSHGCTSGQLDEEALFYLQTRGIPYDSAKAMLLYAFALDVLAPVKNEKLKVYLDSLIAERLNKNF